MLPKLLIIVLLRTNTVYKNPTYYLSNYDTIAEVNLCLLNRISIFMDSINSKAIQVGPMKEPGTNRKVLLSNSNSVCNVAKFAYFPSQFGNTACGRDRVVIGKKRHIQNPKFEDIVKIIRIILLSVYLDK